MHDCVCSGVAEGERVRVGAPMHHQADVAPPTPELCELAQTWPPARKLHARSQPPTNNMLPLLGGNEVPAKRTGEKCPSDRRAYGRSKTVRGKIYHSFGHAPRRRPALNDSSVRFNFWAAATRADKLAPALHYAPVRA